MSRFAIGSPRRLGRRGTTALEMAFVANALVLLVIGGVEVGRYFFVSESVKYVVGEVARAAMINPVPNANWNTVIAKAPILKVADFTTLDVTIVPAAAPALSTVTVRASYRYNFNLLPLSGLVNTIDNFVSVPFVDPSVAPPP